MFFLFFLSSVLHAENTYVFEQITCASIEQARASTPRIFSDLGIDPSTLTIPSLQESSIFYLRNDHGVALQFEPKQQTLDSIIHQLYPNHIRQESSAGWFLLNTDQVLFAKEEDKSIVIYSNTLETFSLSTPEKGCLIETNQKFPPFLSNNKKKRMYIEGKKPIISIEQPFLFSQKEPHTLFSNARFLNKPKPLPISLTYAPLVVQLNFSPMFWMFHSAFPLLDNEYIELFKLDPFDSGTIVVFDIQHGAPEPYPSLVAIPFKGFWTPSQKVVDERLRKLFATAQFDYRKGEFGYRWREWDIVAIEGGIIISKSKTMLKEALQSLDEEPVWPLFSSLQQEFFSKNLLGMHYNLKDAAERKKIRINDRLPKEISLGVQPTDSGWHILARSDLKGTDSLSHMISDFWRAPIKESRPLHPIAHDMLSIAARILASGTRPSKYLSHNDLLERKWVSEQDGLFSVHPTATSVEIHYCSPPKTPNPLHFTWVRGMLYQNPTPCDI